MSDTVDVAARVEPAPAGRPSRGLPRRVGDDRGLAKGQLQRLEPVAQRGGVLAADVRGGRRDHRTKH